MKTITSKEKLLKKLKSNNLVTNGHIYYLSDFHKTKVGKSVSHKLITQRIVEPTVGTEHWFEKSYKLRKEVGKHKGVPIFKEDQQNHFFFFVKKGEYIKETYQRCIDKIDYLDAINEPLV